MHYRKLLLHIKCHQYHYLCNHWPQKEVSLSTCQLTSPQIQLQRHHRPHPPHPVNHWMNPDLRFSTLFSIKHSYGCFKVCAPYLMEAINIGCNPEERQEWKTSTFDSWHSKCCCQALGVFDACLYKPVKKGVLYHCGKEASCMVPFKNDAGSAVSGYVSHHIVIGQANKEFWGAKDAPMLFSHRVEL